MISDLIGNATSSQASESGATHCDSPDGQTTAKSGQAHARASLSARQAKELGLLMSGICGPRGTTSSASAALQSSLESRLRARLQTLGSTLYKMTWKPSVTPSGRSRFRLRASALRTSETERTGWPTTTTRDWKDGGNPDVNVPLNALLGRVAWLAGWTTTQAHDSSGRSSTQKEIHGTKHGCACLTLDAKLAGWPSTRANDSEKRGTNIADDPRNGLVTAANLSGWPTTREADGEKNVRTLEGSLSEIGRKGSPQDLSQASTLCGPLRLTVSGELQTGSPAATESGGQLSPAHSRWLMGLPPEWGACAVMAMQSLPKRLRRSSKPP